MRVGRIWLLLLLLVLVISPFRIVRVYGKSMEPTLHDGETYVLDLFYYRVSDLRQGDIVVVRHNGEQLVKRLFGLPGDRIQFVYSPFGWVYQITNITVHPELARPPDALTRVITVPEGHVYVVGDNLPQSEDSRRFGAIPKADVIGVLRTFTLNRDFPFPEERRGNLLRQAAR